MSLDEGLSAYLGDLYEAVYDEDAWRGAIVELLSRTKSHLALITSVDLRRREYNKTSVYGSDKSSVSEGLREYNEELFHLDPSLAWASRHPYAGFCDTSSILPPTQYLSHPFIVWSKSRLGSTHWSVAYTPPMDDLSFSLSLHAPAELGPVPTETQQLLKLVFAHMERAIRLAARPPDFSTTADALFVLDQTGRVLSMSPRAEQLVELRDGIVLHARRLVTSSPSLVAALENAVAGGAGGSARIKRASGRPDWFAIVSSWPRLLHLPAPTAAALVRVIETTEHPRLSPAHAALFGLTEREVAVADALLAGHSIESLSERLCVSTNTIRFHLKSLFRKTETNRQSDLMRLLAYLSSRQ